MSTLTILVHSGIREPYLRAGGLDDDLVIVNKGAFGSAYTSYAHTLRQTGRLDALLEDIGASHTTYDRIVVVTFSAGYALARWLFAERESRERVDAYVALDSIYASLDEDGADDDQMAPFVAFALAAKEGRKVCYIGCTDVPTPYASTSQTATHIARLAGMQPPAPNTMQQVGQLRIEYHDEHASHGAEHSAALTSWGARLYADALAALSSLPSLSEDEDEDEDEPLGVRALTRAITYLGVSEETARHRKQIRGWHAMVGGDWLKASDPWCASFASATALEVAGGRPLPHAATFRVREMWSSAIARGTAVGISRVRSGQYEPQVGDLLVMSRGSLPRGEGTDAIGPGHVGRIEHCINDEMTTVDGNKLNRVKRCTYGLSDPYLVGVIMYPGEVASWDPSAEEILGICALESEAFARTWL